MFLAKCPIKQHVCKRTVTEGKITYRNKIREEFPSKTKLKYA